MFLKLGTEIRGEPFMSERKKKNLALFRVKARVKS
jgi:hypothetical protein